MDVEHSQLQHQTIHIPTIQTDPDPHQPSTLDLHEIEQFLDANPPTLEQDASISPDPKIDQMILENMKTFNRIDSLQKSQ